MAGREVPLELETWSLFTSAGNEPDEEAEAEQSELLTTLQQATRMSSRGTSVVSSLRSP